MAGLLEITFCLIF